MVVYTLHAVRWLSRRSCSARIALLPVIAGVSYELIRFAAKRRGSFLATADRARPVAAAHHHQAAVRRPGGGRHPRARRRHGARREAGRRTGHRLNPPCNSLQKLDQLEKRFDELTQQMADPAVISDARPVPQSHQGAERTCRSRRQVSRVEEGRRTASRRRAPMLQETDPDLRAMAEEEVARAGAGDDADRRGAQDPAAAQGSATTRRTSCSKSAPARAATRPRCSRPRSSACTRATRKRRAGRWKSRPPANRRSAD